MSTSGSIMCDKQLGRNSEDILCLVSSHYWLIPTITPSSHTDQICEDGDGDVHIFFCKSANMAVRSAIQPDPLTEGRLLTQKLGHILSILQSAHLI